MSRSMADTWSGASYERIAETFAPIHDRMVEPLAIEPGTRAHAERVYLDYLAPGVLARNYVLVLGTRR